MQCLLFKQISVAACLTESPKRSSIFGIGESPPLRLTSSGAVNPLLALWLRASSTGLEEFFTLLQWNQSSVFGLQAHALPCPQGYFYSAVASPVVLPKPYHSLLDWSRGHVYLCGVCRCEWCFKTVSRRQILHECCTLIKTCTQWFQYVEWIMDILFICNSWWSLYKNLTWIHISYFVHHIISVRPWPQ